MKDEYKKRYKVEFKLSEKQLEQMSGHHLIDLFLYFHQNSLKELANINPEWIEQQRYKDISCWYEDELKNKGDVRDIGRFKVKKAKKGYVLTMQFNWRSKGLKKSQYVCSKCKKAELLNFELLCKKCTKELKKKKKFTKFWQENPSILKCQKK